MIMIIEQPDPHRFLHAELRRDLALSRAQQLRILRVMTLLTIGGGALLFSLGAWPVVGFLGLDLLLVWGAFRLYERGHARDYERIVLEADKLVIEQHGGRAPRIVEYEPTFLQVLMSDERASQPIELCKSGRSLQIGRWLGPDERLQFAARLKQALRARQAALPHL